MLLSSKFKQKPLYCQYSSAGSLVITRQSGAPTPYSDCSAFIIVFGVWCRVYKFRLALQVGLANKAYGSGLIRYSLYG